MRRLLTLLLVALAAASLAGCSTPGGGTTDPYEVARKAMTADWGAVQVDVGVSVKGTGSSDLVLPPGAIRFVHDPTAKKTALHVAIPTSIIGSEAASGLSALGISGDELGLDIVFDGTALYAKSAVLGSVLRNALVQAGQTPPPDMSGWLKLGTKAEFEALKEKLGPLASAGSDAERSAPPDAATLKRDLEASGITLTWVGTETKNGVDAGHVKVGIDLTKFTQGPRFGTLDQTRQEQVKALARLGTASADVWVASATSRLVEADLHVASGEKIRVEMTVAVGTPDGSLSLEAPTGATDLPLMQLLTPLLDSFGRNLLGS